MLITILTDNPNSWIIPFVNELLNELKINHHVNHVYKASEINYGDIMFILSCEKILKPEYLKFHKKNIVVHPSKLPMGKGWSPLAWQILEGSNSIPISLFEAVEELDSGNIYLVETLELNGHELNEEIKQKQGLITIKMINYFIDNYNSLTGKPQIGEESFYPRRSKKENEIDVYKSISEQFNLLRVVDNERYPAHFFYLGKKYILKIYRED
jgi:methionyl-tRNA formyltransferase